MQRNTNVLSHLCGSRDSYIVDKIVQLGESDEPP